MLLRVGLDPACLWSITYSPITYALAYAGDDGVVALSIADLCPEPKGRRPHVPVGGLVRQVAGAPARAHMHAHSHTLSHTYTHTYASTRICTHAHAHTHICAHTLAHIRAHAHTHINAHTHTCKYKYNQDHRWVTYHFTT